MYYDALELKQLVHGIPYPLPLYLEHHQVT